jgi:uncharacterized protein
MRILTISDKVEPVLYGPYIRERVGKVDLVLACGDLPYHYLEYAVSLLDVPLYYVHGNHDPVAARNRNEALPVEASIPWANNLHLRRAEHEGLLLAGLEGCRRYAPDRPYQYEEYEVRLQTFWLGLKLLINKLRTGRFVDVIITHSPPRGIHDGEDLAHQGFESYLQLMRWFRPLLLIHGHQHVYNRSLIVDSLYGTTHVMNTYGYRIIELARAHGEWQLVSSGR